jgi:hypothetical protein
VRLNEEIVETIKRVTPNAIPCQRGGSRAIRAEARWKPWPCVFPQHGPGRKHLRKSGLELWQTEIVAKSPERLSPMGWIWSGWWTGSWGARGEVAKVWA